MNNNISKILNDLYKIDPELKEHQADLINIINKLLESRPDTKFDKAFARELKGRLISRARGLKQETGAQANLLQQFMNIKKFVYILGSAAIIILIVLSANSFLKTNPTKNMAGNNSNRTGDIARLDSRAFGKLSLSGDAANSTPAEGPAALKADSAIGATGLGGGGVPGALETSKAIAPNYEFVNYEYVYRGSSLPEFEDSMDVYRRLDRERAIGDIINSLNKQNLGLINLAEFRGASVSSLNIVEDREFGYMLYVNAAEGMISINPNWEKWPHAEEKCWQLAPSESKNCYEKTRLKISDVPEDSEIIAIADKFLADYGINTDDYGPGATYEPWRDNFGNTEDGMNGYIPDEVNVVYPLKINNQPAFDEGGNKTGMIVNVNIRYKKAAGLQGLRYNNFESSRYALETGTGDIIKLAEKGGLYARNKYEGAAKTVQVELGDPELVLMHYWQNNSASKANSELFIPALKFPIENTADLKNFYRKNIMVPLVKDIFDSLKNNSGVIPGPMPRPMPLLEGAPAVQSEVTEP